MSKARDLEVMENYLRGLKAAETVTILSLTYCNLAHVYILQDISMS